MTILDLDCYDDLDELGGELTDPLDVLEQDNFHRLIEPPGSNIDDPAAGLGLPLLVSGSSNDIASLGPRIEGELLKDKRNQDVSALVLEVERGVYDITITIVPNAEELGTTERELVMKLLAKDDGSVELL